MSVPSRLVALLLAMASVSALAAQDRSAPLLTIHDLGRGAVALDGPWQFHPGDSPSWALPQTDDATGQNGWTQITTDKPWGRQGFRSLSGYAWYRKHISVSPAAGSDGNFVLQIPLFDSIAQVYRNGRLIASTGRMPPHASWPGDGCSCTSLARSFSLGAVRDGVLAIRVWLEPLMAFDSGLEGGFRSPLYIGSRADIGDREHTAAHQFLLHAEYSYALQFLALLVGIFSLIAWLRDRSRKVLLWMALYCAAQVTGTLVELAGPMFTNARRNIFFNCSDILSAISVWFLLLYLLRLDGNRSLMRRARVVALVGFACQTVDSSLFLPVFNLGDPSVVRVLQGGDWILGAIIVPCYFFPLAILGAVIHNRRRLDLSRRVLAVSAFLETLGEAVSLLLMYGDRFTHWTAGFCFFQTVKIGNTELDGPTIANTIFFLAVIYAVLRYSRESLRCQQAVEQELRSAQELQQVLVPQALPSLPGFAITSSCRPAQEVGGDFFQIVPLEDSSALVVLGDVSGKGLRAAMAVSLIVGAVRTLARSHPHPADIPDGLNRELHGRLQGGFVTCLALRLYPNGECAVAAAGHPAPFLNGQQMDVVGAVPLGIETNMRYEELRVRLGAGDFLVLYTDGLPEARSAGGEIFSFERLSTLFSDRPSAEEAVLAGQRFGQQDDITVLTLTRLSAGQEAHTELIAPVLAPA
ncbi:MAG TPA: PP2C family protein-serine/threonine phosphatase [Acidobacteriaceae bacterium]|nr:PP2C family protein-serine/threonine phosphatase [Acidobacteriaceae bacterium]